MSRLHSLVSGVFDGAKYSISVTHTLWPASRIDYVPSGVNIVLGNVRCARRKLGR